MKNYTGGNMSASFRKFAGYSAIIAGLLVIAYSIAFVVLQSPLLYSLAQLFGSVLTLVVSLALYQSLRTLDESFALLALVLSVVSFAGGMTHAGYDLANVLNPPVANVESLANLPSQVDARGLLTFGVSGIGTLIFAWLIARSVLYPRLLGYVGYALAGFLLLTYLGRLIVLTPSNPLVLGPAALTGLVLNPLFYIWLGLHLLKSE